MFGEKINEREKHPDSKDRYRKDTADVINLAILILFPTCHQT